MNRIKKKWHILGVLVIAWLIFTTIYASFFVTVPQLPSPPAGTAPQNTNPPMEIAKFVFLSISAFGVLFSALLTSFNTLEATLAAEKTAQEDRASSEAHLEFERVENAFRYFERWDTPSIKDARNFTRELLDGAGKLSPIAMLDQIATKPNLKSSVITMFNFFEEIAMSINIGRVSEAQMRSAFAEPYCGMVVVFNPWIDAHLQPTQQGHIRELFRKWS